MRKLLLILALGLLVNANPLPAWAGSIDNFIFTANAVGAPAGFCPGTGSCNQDFYNFGFQMPSSFSATSSPTFSILLTGDTSPVNVTVDNLDMYLRCPNQATCRYGLGPGAEFFGFNSINGPIAHNNGSIGTFIQVLTNLSISRKRFFTKVATFWDRTAIRAS